MGRSFVIFGCIFDFFVIFVFFFVFNFLLVDKLLLVCLLDIMFLVDFCLDERICWILGIGVGILLVFIVIFDDDILIGCCISFLNVLVLKVLCGVGFFWIGVCIVLFLVKLFVYVFLFLVVFVLMCFFLFLFKGLEFLILFFRFFNFIFDLFVFNLFCIFCSENFILDLCFFCFMRRVFGVMLFIVFGFVLVVCVFGVIVFLMFLVLLNLVVFVFVFDDCVIFLVFDLINWFWLMFRLEIIFFEVFVFWFCFVWVWKLDFEVKGELNWKLFLEKVKVLGFEFFNWVLIFFMEIVFVGGKNGVGIIINFFWEIWVLVFIRDKYMYY